MMRNLALKEDGKLAEYDDSLAKLGELANQVAESQVFADYHSRKSENTIRRQKAGLALFAKYLTEKNVQVGDLSIDPQAWQGVTWGLVAGFMLWQLNWGYAVSSANVRLSTIKTYAKLALKAGAIKPDEYALIRAVEGYSRKEGKRIDEQREALDISTRLGNKKVQAVSLTRAQAKSLKNQPETAQGRRDALLMGLLLDHGLRVGEVVILMVEHFNLNAETFTFYRPKVDKVQVHELTMDTMKAARAYFEHDAPKTGLLLRASASKRDGRAAYESSALTDQGMSERAITKRVRVLGEVIGIEGLSAHDCRHYWATQAARSGTPVDRLQDAGGWSSPAMPLRYVEAAKIANKGIKLE